MMGENGKVGAQERATAQAPLTSNPDDEGHMAPAHSKRSPAFQFYPSDFFSSAKVDRMPMTERGAYITLLARCWLDDGLSTDMGELAGHCRMKLAQFERMWKHSQIGKCFVERGGKYRNVRLDQEHQKQVEYRKRQSDHGKRGGRPTGKGLESQPLSGGKGTERSPISSSSLSSSSSIPSVEHRAPIIQRRRMDAAYEHESGLYVPNRAHQDLLPQHKSEQELFDWYPSVCAAWMGRATGADMIKFWKARHDETWPPEQPSQPARPRPSWAPKAAQS